MLHWISSTSRTNGAVVTTVSCRSASNNVPFLDTCVTLAGVPCQCGQPGPENPLLPLAPIDRRPARSAGYGHPVTSPHSPEQFTMLGCLFSGSNLHGSAYVLTGREVSATDSNHCRHPPLVS